MGGVPGRHVPGLFAPGAIMMAEDRGTIVRALGPVAAGGIAAGRREKALRIGAGENVMGVHGVATPGDGLALFGQRGLLGEIVVTRM